MYKVRENLDSSEGLNFGRFDKYKYKFKYYKYDMALP